MKSLLMASLLLTTTVFANGEDITNGNLIRQALRETISNSKVLECHATKGSSALNVSNASIGMLSVVNSKYYTVSVDDSASTVKVLFSYKDGSYDFSHFLHEYAFTLSADEQSVQSMTYNKYHKGFNSKNVGTIVKPAYENISFLKTQESYVCELQLLEIE
jgi:hypothetical protein